MTINLPALRAAHQPTRHGLCHACSNPHPCITVRLAAEVERLTIILEGRTPPAPDHSTQLVDFNDEVIQ